MRIVVQPVGGYEIGIRTAKLTCPVVHQLRKPFHGTADVDRKCDRRVVAGGKHEAIQQILNFDLFSVVQIHAGAFHGVRFFWHGYDRIQCAIFKH